jgi:hypothetical protein
MKQGRTGEEESRKKRRQWGDDREKEGEEE